MIEEVAVQKELCNPDQEDIYDLIVIGAGPGGMSAALCAGRAKLKCLIIDKALPGGQATTAYRIYNYLGFPEGILGVELADRMETHLKDYNVAFACEGVEDILGIHEPVKTVKTDLDHRYKAKGIILAVGLEPKPLGRDFERQFLGRGISYYAQSDVEHYAGKDVAVIGGGNCACYAAEHLSQYVNKLYLIHQSDFIKSVKSLREKVLNNDVIDVFWNTDVTEIFGIDHVEKIKLFNSSTQQHTWLDVKGVFIYAGRIPPKNLISVEIDVDERGYIITDECMRTNIKGVYAAGDVRSKQIRQIATAVSDGMIAAINLDRDLKN